MHKPLKKEIMSAFETFYDSNWYILGNSVEKFESDYAYFNNTKFSAGLSNGLDALHIALKSLHIGKGDEVIIPSNTYIATALAVSYTGATPILVEPSIITYNINPLLIESAITKNTKAIIVVHLYGQACQMDIIIDIAKKYKLYIIEDNAQSQGARFNNKITGSWGDINATSFYPGKNLGALGDAGAITTDNEELYNKAKVLRNYGSQKKYYNEIIGYNTRLDECQAAILSIKLKYLNQWNLERQIIASKYISELKSIKKLILPHTEHLATHIYHLFVIRIKERNQLQQYLLDNGVSTLIHYPIPLHLQEAYKNLGFKIGDFPVAEEIASTILSLPIWPGMNDEQIYYITDLIKNYYK